MTRSLLFRVSLLLAICLQLVACAAGTRPAITTGPDLEALLVEAGFVRNPADTPEKMARISSEVQRKVIPVREEGQTYYLYADTEFCRCLYVGDEAAFARFEDLLYMRNVERSSCIDERLRTTQVEPWREFGQLGSLCRESP